MDQIQGDSRGCSGWVSILCGIGAAAHVKGESRVKSSQVIEVDRRVIGTVKGLTFFEMSFIKFNDNVD